MPATLMPSWASEPRKAGQSEYAAETPTLAAAGIVVTEISTPMSAPDLAVLSDRIPAVPAQNATKNAKKSGLAIDDERLWSRSLNVSGVTPVALKMTLARRT